MGQSHSRTVFLLLLKYFQCSNRRTSTFADSAWAKQVYYVCVAHPMPLSRHSEDCRYVFCLLPLTEFVFAVKVTAWNVPWFLKCWFYPYCHTLQKGILIAWDPCLSICCQNWQRTGKKAFSFLAAWNCNYIRTTVIPLCLFLTTIILLTTCHLRDNSHRA